MPAVHHGFAPGRRLDIKLKSLPIVCNEDEHVAEKQQQRSARKLLLIGELAIPSRSEAI